MSKPNTDGYTDPDFQGCYVNPRAWRNAKRAFGVKPDDHESGGMQGRAMVALERNAHGRQMDVRFTLAAAIRLYLALPASAHRVVMQHAYDADEAFLHPLPPHVDTTDGRYAVELLPTLHDRGKFDAQVTDDERVIYIHGGVSGHRRDSVLKKAVESIDHRKLAATVAAAMRKAVSNGK